MQKPTSFLMLALFVATMVLATFLIAPQAEARRGCCSWHGGVCGCRCCDGSPLSSTCAPYYPSCSSGGSYSNSLPDTSGWSTNDWTNYISTGSTPAPTPPPPPDTSGYYGECEIGSNFNLDAITNFDGFYKKILGRAAKCDELNFHNSRVTPHERLQSWLYGQVAERRSAINIRYGDILFRDARIDEIDFHISHKTPLNRLESYLFSSPEREEGIERVYKYYGLEANAEAVEFHRTHKTPLSRLEDWIRNEHELPYKDPYLQFSSCLIPSYE